MEVLIRRADQDADTYRTTVTWGHREETVVNTPRREALNLGFWPPGLRDHTFLSFKPLHVKYFGVAALPS